MEGSITHSGGDFSQSAGVGRSNFSAEKPAISSLNQDGTHFFSSALSAFSYPPRLILRQVDQPRHYPSAHSSLGVDSRSGSRRCRFPLGFPPRCLFCPPTAPGKHTPHPDSTAQPFVDPRLRPIEIGPGRRAFHKRPSNRIADAISDVDAISGQSHSGWPLFFRSIVRYVGFAVFCAGRKVTLLFLSRHVSHADRRVPLWFWASVATHCDQRWARADTSVSGYLAGGTSRRTCAPSGTAALALSFNHSSALALALATLAATLALLSLAVDNQLSSLTRRRRSAACPPRTSNLNQALNLSLVASPASLASLLSLITSWQACPSPLRSLSRCLLP